MPANDSGQSSSIECVWPWNVICFPADLADGDGDSDILLGLPCADGFVAKYSTSLGAWDCAQDNDILAALSCQSGEIPVHSHCYRADGILMLMRASEQFGFKILTLQHVLEGYKVALIVVRRKAGQLTGRMLGQPGASSSLQSAGGASCLLCMYTGNRS